MKQNDECMQNLRDAGCDAKLIEQFCKAQDHHTKQLRLLASYRRSLLTQIHAEQKKLDCLDYLLYQLKKGE